LNNELHGKIKELETKNWELSTKCDAKHKMILKFTQGQENFDRLLSTQRASFNKEGIEDDYFNKKKNYKNFFVMPTLHEMNVKTCNYCSKDGHTAYSCPLKKSTTKIIQIWVPKGTRPNVVAYNLESRFDTKSRRNG